MLSGKNGIYAARIPGNWMHKAPETRISGALVVGCEGQVGSRALSICRRSQSAPPSRWNLTRCSGVQRALGMVAVRSVVEPGGRPGFRLTVVAVIVRPVFRRLWPRPRHRRAMRRSV